MCANTHSATSATARLRPWPTSRSGAPPPEAEYTTVMPRAMVTASVAMSGPSMRRDSSSKARLITGGLLRFEGLAAGGALAQQVEIEHLARDRRRRAAAAAAVLHRQRHRELGVVSWGEGDEERVVAVLLAQPARVVFLPLLHA